MQVAFSASGSPQQVKQDIGTQIKNAKKDAADQAALLMALRDRVFRDIDAAAADPENESMDISASIDIKHQVKKVEKQPAAQ